MSRPRSSTAELAVLIDGFYDDFESHPAEVDSPSPTADVNESAADMHATDEALPPTLDSARQVNELILIRVPTLEKMFSTDESRPHRDT